MELVFLLSLQVQAELSTKPARVFDVDIPALLTNCDNYRRAMELHQQACTGRLRRDTGAFCSQLTLAVFFLCTHFNRLWAPLTAPVRYDAHDM